MILGLYFLIVVAVPLALGTYVVYNGLPRSTRCPSCADDTVRLRSRPHRLAGRLVSGDLHRRWCLRCGWSGTVRLDPISYVASTKTSGTAAVSGRVPAHTRDRVDLRRLQMDGDDWRVMVECWAEGGRWVARLIFQDPAGRICQDERSLEGRSVLEVISQAYRLPEQALAGRLRRSIR